MDRLEKENSPPRRNLRRQNHGITNLGEQQEVQPAAASMPPSQLEGNLSISSVASTAGSATSASSSVSSFPISPRHALPTVKRKSRREHRQSNYKHGKWTRDERLLFLKGVRAYGWGRWKEIGGTFLTTRSCVQINSHGQKVMGKIREQGMESIMKELEDAEKEGTAPPSPEHVRRHREQYLEQQRHEYQWYPPMRATETAGSAPPAATTAAPNLDVTYHDQTTLQNTVASNDEVEAAIAMCTMGNGSRSSTPSSSATFFEI